MPDSLQTFEVDDGYPTACPDCGAPEEEPYYLKFICGSRWIWEDGEAFQSHVCGPMGDYAKSLRRVIAGLVNSMGLQGTGIYSPEIAARRFREALAVIESNGQTVAGCLPNE